MSSYGIRVDLATDLATARPLVEAALADQGFGVLTEIDVAATMKKKLDLDVPGQLILGACNPSLAHRALGSEESIGLLLPCNVVLRDIGTPGHPRTAVEAIDPAVMVRFTGNTELQPVADEAGAKLTAALRTLDHTP
ncbi:DUF302 domain-containing protein [Jatrophihabitans fulvus]